MAAVELSKGCKPKSNVVIALAAFWVNFCLLGVIRSNAVLYRAFVDDYGVTRSEAAWPSGIFGFFMCVTGVLSGFLTHHISIRYLALFGALLSSISVSICSLATSIHHIGALYGALQGIGMGLIVPLTHVILNQNFSKYRAFALGVAYSGSSAGSFVFPPLANSLLHTYGLPGTFLLLGSIMLNSVIGAIFYKSPRKGKSTITSSKDHPQCHYVVSQCEGNSSMDRGDYDMNSTSKCCVHCLTTKDDIDSCHKQKEFLSAFPSLKISSEILSDPHFFIVSIAYAVYFSTSAIFLMVIVDFAQDRGIPVKEGVFFVSAFSIGDFGGRLSFGWIADTQCIQRNILVRFYLLTMGLLTILLPICPVSMLSIFSVLLGILNGSVIVNHSVLLNEYLGLEKLPLAIGFSTCLVGMTAFLRPIIIGIFRDRNHSYNQLFIFIGLLQVFITTMWFVENFWQYIRRRVISVKKMYQ